MSSSDDSFRLPPDQNAGAQKASLVRITHGLINRAVMLADAASIVLAGELFWWSTAADEPPLTQVQALTISLVIAIAFSWAMHWGGHYRVERYMRLWRPAFDIICGLITAALAAVVILEAFVGLAWHHRAWFGQGLLVMFIVLMVTRQVDRLLVSYIRRRALLRRRVIVVGAGPLTDYVVAQLRHESFAQDYQLIGVVNYRNGMPRTASSMPEKPARQLAELVEYAQNYVVDLVIIALPWDQADEIFALIRELQWIAADVVVPFPKTGFPPQIAAPAAFIDAPLLQVMNRPFKGTQGLIKIMEDYVVASVALVLASPILLAAAIAVWIDSGRPVFFLQPRVGFNSKPFMMLKFRSMTIDETDDGSKGTKRDNQRITRVGSFLRRTSIDELPQLINVLRGEMSIVGPRPHVANMLVGEGVYSEVVRQYAARHRIKPGITGWAQINGMRGGIDSLDKAKRGADLDLYYIANWSLRLDLEIMIRTLVVGLAGRNVF